MHQRYVAKPDRKLVKIISVQGVPLIILSKLPDLLKNVKCIPLWMNESTIFVSSLFYKTKIDNYTILTTSQIEVVYSLWSYLKKKINY